MPSPPVRSSSSPNTSAIPTGKENKGKADLDENYAEKRYKAVEALKNTGINPYPYEYESKKIGDIINSCATMDESAVADLKDFTVAGRVMSIRGNFFDLFMDGLKLQIYIRSDQEEVIKVYKFARCGDILGVEGRLGFSKTNELTLYASKVVSLCPCLRELPKAKGIKKSKDNMKNDDHVSENEAWAAGKSRMTKYLLKQESRYQQRYLDMMLHKDVIHVLQVRSKIISYIRCFLNERGFLEVETPILNKIPSGGAAKPFKTADEDNRVYYMRIAPELRLKEFFIGGFSRVFEIGKQFRNEGIDTTHNPEFTSCELYAAFEDYNFLMNLIEDLLSGLVKKLTGGLKIMYLGNELDFTPPYRRINMIEELERKAEVKIPRPFSSRETLQFLANLCKKCNIKCGTELRTGRLLDKLVGHYLEGSCVNPTFIINHPVVMSPMAKEHRAYPGLTERFELFIDKKEVSLQCLYSYTELNDPWEQRQRFAEQLELLKAGDNEAMHNDEAYCTALEYGLPPCAGWGIGIDRLAMFLTDSENIKEVISFT